MVKQHSLKFFGLLLLVSVLTSSPARAGEPQCSGLCLARFVAEEVTAYDFTGGGLLFTGGAHWQPEWRLGASRFGLMPRIGAQAIKAVSGYYFAATDAALLLDVRVGDSWSFFVGPAYSYWFGSWNVTSFMAMLGGRYAFAAPKLTVINGIQLTALPVSFSSGMSLLVSLGASIGF